MLALCGSLFDFISRYLGLFVFILYDLVSLFICVYLSNKFNIDRQFTSIILQLHDGAVGIREVAAMNVTTNKNKVKFYQLLECVVPNLIGLYLGDGLGWGLSLVLLVWSWQDKDDRDRQKKSLFLSLTAIMLLVPIYPGGGVEKNAIAPPPVGVQRIASRTHRTSPLSPTVPFDRLR